MVDEVKLVERVKSRVEGVKSTVQERVEAVREKIKKGEILRLKILEEERPEIIPRVRERIETWTPGKKIREVLGREEEKIEKREVKREITERPIRPTKEEKKVKEEVGRIEVTSPYGVH